jgi:hypothetical protein
MNNYEDKMTDNWLKANGINPATITEWGNELLQAQMIATNLLKHHGRFLGQNEAASLNNFLKKVHNGKERKKLKPRDCFRIMNIGTAVNRKLFKAYRRIQN